MTAEQCSVATESGVCPRPVTLAKPLQLCEEHKIAVALAVVPDLLAGALVEIRADHYNTARPLPEELAHIIDSATAAVLPTGARHPALVYFLLNGGRVKIGHTRGLAARVRALSLREEAVVLLLHGGPSLERALHQKFARDRIGGSEWFELSVDMVGFIARKQSVTTVRPRHTAQRRERIPRARRREARADAELAIEQAIQRGESLNAADIGRRYNMGETWGGDRIRAVRAQLDRTTAETEPS
ncbi:GIY-YIG nuclease family protein [Streptomyces sp. NPDC050147]|uniref:GIY-YIG nuclease family protein n=1 Tax=Streptomyces sp. NPDC050147 TaxID=3155513 RepID=UPI0034446770